MSAATESTGKKQSRRVLDPIDRNSEIMFGLFMVLTFTGTLSVASAGRHEVRTMLVAAIGCNIAWGFVDAVMYVLRSLVARGRKALLRREVCATADRPEHGRRLVTDELGPLSGGLGPKEIEGIRQWLLAHPAHDAHPARPTWHDLRGALGVFLLVFASTFPVVLPFVFLTDLGVAMRVSGAVAIAMLFVCGYGWGRYAGVAPVRTGLVMVLLGGIIQVVIISLGG